MVFLHQNWTAAPMLNCRIACPGTRLRQAALAIALGLLAAPAAQAQPQALPPDVVSCKMSGYSDSRDRAGAPIRAEPNTSAKVLGRLAPPQKARKVDEEDVPPSEGLWRTEFQIIGYRDGWLLIENALHPYDDPDRRSVLGRRSTGGVKTYKGRGWIPLNVVDGKYTYFHRSMPNGALYKEPRADSERLPAKNALDYPIQGGNSPKKVLGCEGDWVKVQSHDDVVGWWKGLCGQPIADCWKD